MSSMPEVPNYRYINDTVFIISYILMLEMRLFDGKMRNIGEKNYDLYR